MNNVLYINKPKGMTSFDICYKLRKVLGTKKIGHTGTLDPNATGVMIVLFDSATKANQFLVSDIKKYTARIKMGIETDTLDTDGNIIRTEEFSMPSKDMIVSVLSTFLGDSLQEVPITSAIKIDGKKLYEYQRQGIEIELPKRKIHVSQIDFVDMYDDGFSFSCTVSSGTYIRSLARDIAYKLNTIGSLCDLRRDMIDNITVDDCDDFDDVLSGKYHAHDLLDVLSLRYKCIEYCKPEDIKNGKRIKIDCNDEMVVITNNRQLLAVYGKDGDEYKSLRGMW